MIEFSNVYLKYTKEFYALCNINLVINKDEVICLYGTQDSGKSCIIRIIAGLEKVSKGEVYIKNIPVKKVDYKHDVKMGYIPYKATFFDKKTVHDNLKYVLKIHKFSASEQEEIINKTIIDFKLEGIRDAKVSDLSLYEKYLVSIARLSFRELEIVLIDNIFEELSEDENNKLLELFKQLYVDKGMLVIYATSNEKISREISTRVIKLDHGVIS